MQFKLCYKSYDYKPSLRAIKEFKESTGLDLWATLSNFLGVYINCRTDGDAITTTISKLAKVIDFVEASQLFYCLAKQESSVSIDEIEDGMFHAGILPSEREHDMSEPYPFVIYQICLDIQEYHSQLSKDVKKPQALS